MQYVNKSFTLPAAPTKITTAEWERIFGKFECQQSRERKQASAGRYCHHELLPAAKGDRRCKLCGRTFRRA